MTSSFLPTASVAVLLCVIAPERVALAAATSFSGTLGSSNQFELHLTGTPGTLYKVESSTDLASWSRFALVINETGSFAFSASADNEQTNRFFRLVLDSPAHRIAEGYSQRVAGITPKAKLAIFDFLVGLDELRLSDHLVDLAFFCEGMQPAEGDPVSWKNSAQVVGSIDRFRGGFALPNFLTTHHFYFTNLPPTPSGRTLVLWAAGNMNNSGVSQDTEMAIVELASAGNWPVSLSQTFYSSGGYVPVNWNGSIQRIYGDPNRWYSYSGVENSLFCLGISSSQSGFEFCFRSDNVPVKEFQWAGADDTRTSPAVLRFGARGHNQPSSAWNGIYRGFVYFDTVLSRSQVMQINSLLPRIGLVVEGDSKSFTQPPSSYWQWWLNLPETWGLYILRTNSAVAGTRVAALNSPLHNSMEERFPDDALFQTNSQFPITLYSLRGGHNDFLDFEKATPTSINNAFTAITNLWAQARSNGFKVVGWTIDRTLVTWSGGAPGNSNLLQSLNSRLREFQVDCDFFVDQEAWYVTNYGETPYTNTLLYRDGVHDQNASPYLGTNLLHRPDWPSLGYERAP